MNETYRRNDNVLARVIAGERVLVPIHGRLADMQRLFALNAVGAFVWDRLDGVRPAGEIAAAVVEAFTVGRDEAVRDVRSFLASLVEAGLVEPA